MFVYFTSDLLKELDKSSNPYHEFSLLPTLIVMETRQMHQAGDLLS